MSFGGPGWPQQPHQGNDRPYQQQPSYGTGPGAPAPGPGGPGGGPGFGFGETGADTPDWGALADASAARARRRRRLFIGGGVLATAAVAAVVAAAVVTTDGGSGRDPAKNGAAPVLPSESARPEPSFSSVAPPPPPNPRDFIASAAKDKAPIGPETLFPGSRLTVGDRAYRKGATAATDGCGSAAQGGLGAVLAKHGCDRVLRATYVRDGVAVTVGVALFENEAAARRAKQEATGGIAPLAGSGVGEFCRATVCLRRANAVGRYAYFTQAGWTSGRKVTRDDAQVFKASDDLGTFTFDQIYARGRAQASAAATAPARTG
ncbi:hypothetical protein NX801_16070 [Streptomyces sp. LP05-1]|uniref:Uncharacterized protein n=1 Tax=Streptomyces pyxinae TaxID=2970734 RepID=A0ABT2CIB2_9ACTN|nr:hypothetical protein [Streptomyces sp. LP05-1]MCS0637150.1 hypothetical protein [Streptomyces sp. LP05-1]